VRNGQHSAEVHLSFKDASAQHRQQLASAGTIQPTMHGPAPPATLPVSTVASKQLPDVTMVPGGINVHGLMNCLLKHLQFGPEYTVVSEYGGDASGDIAAAIPTRCRSDVCIAEVRGPVSDAKLARLPSAFTCFGQQNSVSVQPSRPGQLWGPHHLSFGMWGWGSHPALQLVVRQAGQRLRLFFSFLFFLGGRAIHYTYIQRKKPQASNGGPFAAEAASDRHNLERGKHRSAESQHVKQNKPGTCQLFTNSNYSLSIFTEERSNNVQMHSTEA